MKNAIKFSLACVAVAACGVLMAGCGGGGGGGGPAAVVVKPTPTKPAIIVVTTPKGRFYGYYQGLVFCDWLNDYCGTGVSWGIILNGCSYGGVNTCASSGGTPPSSGGTPPSSGGQPAPTPTPSSGGQPAPTPTPSSGGQPAPTPTPSSGGQPAPTPTPSSGGQPAPTPTPSSGGQPAPTPTPSPCTSTGSTGCNSGTTTGAAGDDTTDSGYLVHELTTTEIDGHADQIVAQYHMNPETARQLAQFSARMQQAIQRGNGQMSDEDRMAVGAGALAALGITVEEASDAMEQFKKGNEAPLRALADKAAQIAGMEHPEQSKEILSNFGVILSH